MLPSAFLWLSKHLTAPQNQGVLAQSSMCQHHCCLGQSSSPVKSLDPQWGTAPGSWCGCAVPHTQPSQTLWLQQPQVPDLFKTVLRTWRDIRLMVQLNKAHLTSLWTSLPNEQVEPKEPLYFYLVLMLKPVPLIFWIIEQLWSFIELYLPWSL